MLLRTEEARKNVRHRRVMRLTRRHWRRVFIGSFICWHLFALTIWALPQTSWLTAISIPAVRPYMTETGFMQGWLMFAPTPYVLDVYVEAHIHYADGHVRSWEFPRMAKMSYWRRYGKERWRKYIEVAHQDAYSFYWPTMARFAARENTFDRHNPPISVDLIRHYRILPTPGQPIPNWTAYPFYTHKISSEELR